MTTKQQQQQFNEIARDPLAFLITAVGGKSNPRPPALQPYATLEEAKAVGPQGSLIRLNAIKTYLRAQCEAKRQAKKGVRQ